MEQGRLGRSARHRPSFFSLYICFLYRKAVEPGYWFWLTAQLASPLGLGGAPAQTRNKITFTYSPHWHFPILPNLSFILFFIFIFIFILFPIRPLHQILPFLLLL